MLRLLGYLVEVYVLVLIVRALLSWVPLRSGSPFIPIVRAFDVVTEPVLRPVRRLLPTARVGGVGLDFSVIVVIIALEVLAGLLLRA